MKVKTMEFNADLSFSAIAFKTKYLVCVRRHSNPVILNKAEFLANVPDNLKTNPAFVNVKVGDKDEEPLYHLNLHLVTFVNGGSILIVPCDYTIKMLSLTE